MIKTHIRTASKTHFCRACGEEILPGQSYKAEVKFNRGRISTRKTHDEPPCERAKAEHANQPQELPEEAWKGLEESQGPKRKLLWSQCRTYRHNHAWLPDCWKCHQRIEWLDEYVREVWRVGSRLVSYYSHVHCPYPEDDEYFRELEEEDSAHQEDWGEEELPLAA